MGESAKGGWIPPSPRPNSLGLYLMIPAITIQDYFKSTIFSCVNCRSDKDLIQHITFDKLPPYLGFGKHRVLIIGHSPKVRTSSEISVTLDLNRRRRLRQYIVDEVLFPLGIDLDCCIATNMVKCFTTKMPEDTVINGKPFMRVAFDICKYHLIHEVSLLWPHLIISLSEQVSTLLQQEFGACQKPKQMKDIFATLQPFSINRNTINWIPVVHIPKASVRAYYFPEQTSRLIAMRGRVQQILNNEE